MANAVRYIQTKKIRKERSFMYFLLEAINRNKYEKLEQGFESFRKNPRSLELNKYIEGLFNIQVKINIVERDFLYGMMVYPSYEDINNIKYTVLASEDGDYIFDRLHFLYIDVDPKTLKQLTNAELTAVLMHELGHKALQYDFNTLIRGNIKSLANNNINLLQRLIILKYILSSPVFFAPSFLRKEIISDSFAISCGYGAEMESALKKVMELNSDLINPITSQFFKARLTQLQKTNFIINDEKTYKQFIDESNRLLLK